MKASNNDDGAVMIWMCALCAVCLLFILGLTKLGAATVTKSHVQNGADAASLSAAYEVARGKNSLACASARSAAQKNKTVVMSCQIGSDDVEVVVRDLSGEITARARAVID